MTYIHNAYTTPEPDFQMFYLAEHSWVLQVSVAAGFLIWEHAESGNATVSIPCFCMQATERSRSPIPQGALQGPNSLGTQLQEKIVAHANDNLHVNAISADVLVSDIQKWL